MKRSIILLLLGIFLITSGTALASDISDAIRQANLVVTNNGTTASYVSVPFSLNSTALINGNYAWDNMTNTCIRTPSGADAPYMPAYTDSDTWTLFVDSIGASTQQNFRFYTGGDTDMNSKICYFPGDSGMTTTDNASLEFSDNFTYELSGYIKTDNATNQYILSKTDAIAIYVSDENEISAVIYGISASDNETRSPISDNYTNITDPSPPHWSYVDDPVDSPDDETTIIYNKSTAEYRDLYYLPSSNITTGSIINSVNVHYRTKANGTFNDYARPLIGLGVSETLGTEIIISSIWTDYSESLSRPSGGSWTAADMNNIMVGIGMRAGSTPASYYPKCTQVYLRVNYDPPATITAENIISGEYDLEVALNSGNFTISINGECKDWVDIGASTVPDNSNDWTFFTNYSVPYMEYQKIYVGGSLKQHITWQNGTTFTDLSGNGNSATPTFRTTSTDADVSAELVNFRPINESVLDDYEAALEALMVTEVPDQPEHLYTEMDTSKIPMATWVNENVLDDNNIPRSLFWLPVCFGSAIVIGLIAFKPTQNLMVMAIVSGFVITWWAWTGVVPGWVLIPYGIIAFGLILSKRVISV